MPQSAVLRSVLAGICLFTQDSSVDSPPAEDFELASYNSLLQNVRQLMISLQQDIRDYNDAIINRCSTHNGLTSHHLFDTLHAPLFACVVHSILLTSACG